MKQGDKEKMRLLVLAAVLAAAVGLAAAGDRFVDSDAGVDSGSCDSVAAPCKTISYGVEQARAGDNVLLRGRFELTKPVTLQETPHLVVQSWDDDQVAEVVCSGSAHAFEVLNSGWLDRLDISGCTGSAVYVYLENTNQMQGGLSRLVVSDSAQGVELKQTGMAARPFELRELTLRNNSRSLASGKALSGCGLSLSQSHALLNGSSVTDNRCSGDGGGVALLGKSGLTVADSELARNWADGPLGGGAVYCDAGGLFSAQGVSVTENGAAQNGGAAYVVQCKVLLHPTSTFLNNSAAAGDGGAVWMNGGYFNATGALFGGNTAAAGNGGAFYGYSVTFWSTRSLWTGNSAVNGGAFYGYSVTFWVVQSGWRGNSGTTRGGALYFDTCTVMANQTGLRDNVLRTRSSKPTHGGALYAQHSTCIFWNVTATNCSADWGGVFSFYDCTAIVYASTQQNTNNVLSSSSMQDGIDGAVSSSSMQRQQIPDGGAPDGASLRAASTWLDAAAGTDALSGRPWIRRASSPPLPDGTPAGEAAGRAVRDALFRAVSGGGAASRSEAEELPLCFSHNNAYHEGGVFECNGTSTIVYDCAVADNSVNYPNAAASFLLLGSTLVATNMTFSNNLSPAPPDPSAQELDIVCINSSTNLYGIPPDAFPVVQCREQCDQMVVYGNHQTQICSQDDPPSAFLPSSSRPAVIRDGPGAISLH